MLVFNELRVNSDKELVIDVSILDMTIDPEQQIAIDHIYVGFGSNNDEDLVDYIDESDNNFVFDRIDRVDGVLRGFRLVINLLPEGNNKKLCYVKVTADTGIIEVPCTIKAFIEGIAYDRCMVISKVFDYIKSTCNPCANIDNYAHYITQVKGLELSVESGNFTLANIYWTKFFVNGSNGNCVNLTSNCGCH